MDGETEECHLCAAIFVQGNAKCYTMSNGCI